MKTYQGVLRELGEAAEGRRTQTMNYTYIEIGDQMIKGAKVFRGLDSKLSLALGKPLTLHVDGSYIVALTTHEGKTYSSEKWGFFKKLVAWALVAVGVPLSFFIIGLPFALMGGVLLYTSAKANAGASLPNAIQIPIPR
jgi:hypothetical protein